MIDNCLLTNPSTFNRMFGIEQHWTLAALQSQAARTYSLGIVYCGPVDESAY